MIRLLQLIIFGHIHQWEILGKTRVFESETIKDDLPIGIKYVLQCKHCGEMKKFETYT